MTTPTTFDISRPTVPAPITIAATQATEIAAMQAYIKQGWKITSTPTKEAR